MTDTMRNLGIGIVLALLLLVGFYFFSHKNALFGGANSSATTTPNATTTISGVSGTGGYTVEQVPVEPPSLTRPISITGLAADATAILRSKIEQQLAILKTDPKRTDVWLQLGLNRKIGSDFSGAIEAWDYVAAVASDATRSVAYGNLGDLYMYFLKDFPKAELNFKQAIVLDPTHIDYYRTLYYLYRDVYKTNTSAASDILKQGLTANPNNPDLLELQAEYNKKYGQ